MFRYLFFPVILTFIFASHSFAIEYCDEELSSVNVLSIEFMRKTNNFKDIFRGVNESGLSYSLTSYGKIKGFLKPYTGKTDYNLVENLKDVDKNAALYQGRQIGVPMELFRRNLSTALDLVYFHDIVIVPIQDYEPQGRLSYDLPVPKVEKIRKAKASKAKASIEKINSVELINNLTEIIANIKDGSTIYDVYVKKKLKTKFLPMPEDTIFKKVAVERIFSAPSVYKSKAVGISIANLIQYFPRVIRIAGIYRLKFVVIDSGIPVALLIRHRNFEE